MPEGINPLKEITIDELINRIDIDPGCYGFLLGAGCSVGAGIPTAGQMIDDIRKRLGPQVPNNYAGALRALGPKRIVRKFIADLIEGKRPGLLHEEIAAFAEASTERNGPRLNYVGAFFTTNFDNLLETALDNSTRGCHRIINNQIAEQAVADGGIHPHGTRSFVVKLHGDFLLNIAVDPSDLAELDDGYKQLFNDWIRANGLVIVGYGAGDRSVVEAIKSAARIRTQGAYTGLPYGLIHAIRHGDKIPDWVYELNDVRPHGWVEVLRIRDGEQLFEDLQAFFCQNLPVRWQLVRDEAAGRAREAFEALEANRMYKAELYETRAEAEAVIQRFLRSKSVRHGILFVGRAGIGKTVFFAHAAKDVLNAGEFAIWFRASDYHQKGDLERFIIDLLQPAIERQTTLLREALYRFSEVLNRADVNHHAVVFVEGINEADDPTALVEETTHLLTVLRDTSRIRLVASCREETFARYPFLASQYWTPDEDDADQLRAHGAGSTPKAPDRRPDAYALRLPGFDQEQTARVWRRYAEFYGVSPAEFEGLLLSAQRLVRTSPLMLRMVAQAWGKQEIPSVISSVSVFTRYFDHFVQGTAPGSAKPTTKGENRLLHLLVDLLVDLDHLVAKRRVPAEQLMEAADEAGMASQVAESAYSTLLAKGVFQEVREHHIGAAGTVQYVGFWYDRLFEFALANRLDGRGYQARPELLEQLVQKGLEYPSLWGAARMLLFIELDRCKNVDDAVVWLTQLLAENRFGLLALVGDALAELAGENPDLVSQICSRLLGKPGAAGYASISAAVQAGLTEVLFAGCKQTDRPTRRRAVQGAIYFWQQDTARGDAFWTRLASEADGEIARNFGSFRRILGLGLKARIAPRRSRSTIQDQVEGQIPAFMALWQACVMLYALSLRNAGEFRPFQDVIKKIVTNNIDGMRYKALNEFSKWAGRRLVRAALDAQHVAKIAEGELRALGNPDYRKACLYLVESWDQSLNVSQPEFAKALDTAALAPLVGSFPIRGALIGRLRTSPSDAVDWALHLAESNDAIVSWQGLTAAGYLVVCACAAGLAKQEQPWFSRLQAALEQYARDAISVRSLNIRIHRMPVPRMHLEHIFVGREESTRDLNILVDELRKISRDAGYPSGERALVRALGALPRLGYAKAALDSLTPWADTSERAVFNELCAVAAELMAAYPSHLSGWLEQMQNPELELNVRQKLLSIDPEEYIFKYSAYSFATIAYHPRASREFIPSIKAVFESAPDDIDGILRIVCDHLFDLERTPWLYATWDQLDY